MVTPDPATNPDAVILDFPDTEDNRLRRALRDLEAAMQDQRDAVADLRGNLADLGAAVGRLGNSAAALEAGLADTAARTAEAGDAARNLEATAMVMEDMARR